MAEQLYNCLFLACGLLRMNEISVGAVWFISWILDVNNWNGPRLYPTIPLKIPHVRRNSLSAVWCSLNTSSLCGHPCMGEDMRWSLPIGSLVAMWHHFRRAHVRAVNRPMGIGTLGGVDHIYMSWPDSKAPNWCTRRFFVERDTSLRYIRRWISFQRTQISFSRSHCCWLKNHEDSSKTCWV